MSHTRNIKLIHEIHEAWARDNGYRPQAASVKPQASSVKPEDLHSQNTNRFVEAASHKRQAPSTKVQASSRKRQAP